MDAHACSSVCFLIHPRKIHEQMTSLVVGWICILGSHQSSCFCHNMLGRPEETLNTCCSKDQDCKQPKLISTIAATPNTACFSPFLTSIGLSWASHKHVQPPCARQLSLFNQNHTYPGLNILGNQFFNCILIQTPWNRMVVSCNGNSIVEQGSRGRPKEDQQHKKELSCKHSKPNMYYVKQLRVVVKS